MSDSAGRAQARPAGGARAAAPAHPVSATSRALIEAAGLLGFGVAWLLPGHYFPWESFWQEAASAIGLAVLALEALALPRAWPARAAPPALAAAALSVVPLVQWAGGLLVFHSDAVLAFAYLLAFALAVVVGQQLSAANGRRFLHALFLAVVFSAIASTGLGLAQWLHLGPFGFLEELGPLERVSANFKQPNQFASLLGLAVTGVLWQYETSRVRGAVAALAIAFLGFGLVMTESRTGWLFVLGFGVVWLLFGRRLRLRAPRAVVVTALLVFFALAAAWGQLNHWLLLSDSVSLAHRLEPGRRGVIWATMIDAISRAPWAGYGWQQVPSAELAAALDHSPINYWLTSAHNLALDLLIWNGIPVGLTVVAVAAWWFVGRARRCRDADHAAPLVALGVLGLHSMLELPLHYAYYLLFAGLLAGVVEEQSRQATVRPAPKLPRAAVVAAWTGLCVLLAWAITEYPDVEEAVRRARLRDAHYVQPGAPPEPPDVRLLDGPREFLRMWLTEPTVGMSPAQLDWMRTVATRYPAAPMLFKYALATGLNGRAQDAGRTLELLCRVAATERCAVARGQWEAALAQYPQLKTVALPDSWQKDR